MSFDRDLARAISRDIENALRDVAEKHGVTIKAGGGRFTAETFDLKLNIVAKATDGSVQTKEALAWNKLAAAYGFKAEDLGRKFYTNGETYVVTGLKPNAKKFPVLARKQSNGVMYKFAAHSVKAALETAAKVDA